MCDDDDGLVASVASIVFLSATFVLKRQPDADDFEYVRALGPERDTAQMIS